MAELPVLSVKSLLAGFVQIRVGVPVVKFVVVVPQPLQIEICVPMLPTAALLRI